MEEAMDAQTWTIVIAVVLGFFAVPAVMLGYDMRRQRRQRALGTPPVAARKTQR